MVLGIGRGTLVYQLNKNNILSLDGICGCLMIAQQVQQKYQTGWIGW